MTRTCTVYCFCYFNKCLTNKSGVTLRIKNLCQIAYDDWMAETEHEITPAGRIKAPSRHSCVERILAAWESLPSDIIRKSFEVCAISLPTDGSEDEEIRCFQKEGPLSNEREEFTERAAAFYAALGQGAPVHEIKTTHSRT